MRTFKSPRDFVQRGASWAYRNSLRHLMPLRKVVSYASVEIDVDRRAGDGLLIPGYYRSRLADIPDYEEALVRGLNMYVAPGTTVVIVGGGIGVTAVIAAQLVGPEGKVICYEASFINVGRIRETARRNNVSDRLYVHYGVVGPAIAVYHEDNKAPQIDLATIPECDLLELDCEGSEKDILANLTVLPKHVLVETHGVYGAPTETIDALLRENGYETTLLGIAEPRRKDACIKHDIHVIAARF